MDAITRGTLDGLALLLGIVAMLIVLIALVSLVEPRRWGCCRNGAARRSRCSACWAS